MANKLKEEKKIATSAVLIKSVSIINDWDKEQVKWGHAVRFMVQEGSMSKRRELNVLFSPQLKVPRPSDRAMVE